MSADALYAEFTSIPKAAVMASCAQLLQQVRVMSNVMRNANLTTPAIVNDREAKGWGIAYFQSQIFGRSQKVCTGCGDNG
jgi:formamidopyrimidine-DNA glycosylase